MLLEPLPGFRANPPRSDGDISFSGGLNGLSPSPVPTSHAVTAPSSATTATVLPSGDRARAWMLFSSPAIGLRSLPVATSQRRTVSPPLEAARVLPSADTATTWLEVDLRPTGSCTGRGRLNRRSSLPAGSHR